MKKIFLGFLAFSLILVAGQRSIWANFLTNTPTTSVPTNKTLTHEGLLQKNQECGFPIHSRADFLYYVDNFATFEDANGNAIFFRKDGTMGGSGLDGEPSMWEANWRFEAGKPTGKIIFTLTMSPANGYFFMNGAYHVEYFPDDAALIFNCKDFIKQNY